MKKINQVIEDFIKDLSPNMREEFLQILDLKNTKNITEVRKKISSFKESKKFLPVGNFTSNYWTQRGWSIQEANIFKEKNKIDHCKNGSPMNKNFWLCRINPNTGNNYTEEEALYKIRSQRKYNIEYWIERGYNKDDAYNMVRKEQIKNSSKAKEKSLKDPSFYFNRTWNQKGYWIKKGFSEEDAIKKISELQKTIDLDRLIKKYGDIEGREKYNNICNKLKYTNSLQGYRDKYGQLFGDSIFNKKITAQSYSSRESILFFIKVYKILRNNGIMIDDIKWGIKGSKEFFLYDSDRNKIFWYDFTILSKKIIIEYHGSRWHPNPKWDKDKLDRWSLFGMSSSDKLLFDDYKNSIARNNGFHLIELWDHEVVNFDYLKFTNSILSINRD